MLEVLGLGVLLGASIMTIVALLTLTVLPNVHPCERCFVCRKIHQQQSHEKIESWEVPHV